MFRLLPCAALRVLPTQPRSGTPFRPRGLPRRKWMKLRGDPGTNEGRPFDRPPLKVPLRRRFARSRRLDEGNRSGTFIPLNNNCGRLAYGGKQASVRSWRQHGVRRRAVHVALSGTTTTTRRRFDKAWRSIQGWGERESPARNVSLRGSARSPPMRCIRSGHALAVAALCVSAKSRPCRRSSSRSPTSPLTAYSALPGGRQGSPLWTARPS